MSNSLIMTSTDYRYLLNCLDELVNKETCELIVAVNFFCVLGYAFDLKKLIDGVIEVYPLDGDFYIIEFTGYKVELKGY